MTIQPLQENESCLAHGVKSAFIGSVIGYGAKYVLPLTNQEMDSDYKNVISTIRNNTIKNHKQFLKDISSNETRSLSNDAFIKSSRGIARKSVHTYNKSIKKMRPTAPFVVAGAVSGLLVSFIQNAFD